MAKKGSSDIVIQIRCKSLDTKIAFKMLAVKVDANFEETLRQLLQLEKQHPLLKQEKGLVLRL